MWHFHFTDSNPVGKPVSSFKEPSLVSSKGINWFCLQYLANKLNNDTSIAVTSFTIVAKTTGLNTDKFMPSRWLLNSSLAVYSREGVSSSVTVTWMALLVNSNWNEVGTASDSSLTGLLNWLDWLWNSCLTSLTISDMQWT